MPSNPDVTMLLQAWHGGDQQALGRLVPLVRTEIHRLAAGYMSGSALAMSFKRQLWSTRPICV
jgi:hypothetical protein